MRTNGFTLIELLVVIAIIGLVSAVALTTLTSTASKAQAAYELRLGGAVQQAFKLKALDDGINTWWHEDDFPESNRWESYIEDIVAEGLITEFLPAFPDDVNYGSITSRTYAYDNDNDVFNDPADCYTFTGNNWRGVNFIYHLDLDPNTDKWQTIVEYMDEAIDKSDGPYCGRLRYHTTGQINYMIDNDQTPDF